MLKRVLVTEALSAEGVALLEQHGQVESAPNLSPAELLALVPGYDALIVRSATEVSTEVIAAGARLAVIARAGTGVDNIDVDAATRRGILVVNAPTSNTVAVAEHTLALMLGLARHIPQADACTHAGRWERGRFMGTELRDKTLGLVGFGRAGTAVASRARGMEMRVIAHDPFVAPERAQRLGIELVAIEELLARADYVSLHVPATDRTRGMIGARELSLMKPSAHLINCARGDLIEEGALVDALLARQIAGAALDVFADEPHIGAALCQCPNVILTPHLGASTIEAQSGAALDVARQVADVLAGRQPRYPVNITAISAEELSFVQPYLDLADRLGRFHAQYAHNNLSEIEITFGGDVSEHNTNLIAAALLAGLLREAGDEGVNLVNARLLATERGLAISEVRTPEAQGFSGLITLVTRAASGARTLSGTLMRNRPHLVQIDEFWLDFVLDGYLLLSEHIERPGVIGQMGAALGEAGISISFVQVGRQERGGRGLMVMGLDEPPGPDVLARISALPSIRAAWGVRL